jgi:hypothetical protein
MARIRTIKPEFWTDEKIIELSPFARLLFIGLWNFADDEGRLVYSPVRLKLQILPADDQNISELFGEIRGKKLVEVYTVDNIEYLQINKFSDHQKIDKRNTSKLPPPENFTQFTPISPELPRRIKEGIKEGKEKKESFAKKKVPVTEKGTRMSVDHLLPIKWKKWCAAEHPTIDVEKEFLGFRDYWLGVPGQRGVKLDWFATFRNRVRSAAERNKKVEEPSEFDKLVEAEKHHQLGIKLMREMEEKRKGEQDDDQPAF